MLVIVGTIPIKDMPLTTDFCEFNDEKLKVGEADLPLINGTSALVATAAATCSALKIQKPYAVLAGDIGTGEGSNKIYRFLRDSFKPPRDTSEKTVIAMHYIKPNVLYAKDAIKALRKHANTTLIADAGSMYVAKAAKLSKDFDLFTPDPGEMAFLADPEAMHPAYVRSFIFDAINDVPALIKQAYQNFNAAKFLLVKGVTDFIVDNGEIVANVSEPCISALEAVGGTGDTLVGIVSTLIASGCDIPKAAVKAAKANRFMGALAKPTPATKVWEMIQYIPKALEAVEKASAPN
ncbi:MAG: sugar kinase [Candidatus Bathyarchaeota archaeon]|nr:sugar kinase [Candidatus Bathyarchaeota archaeon]